MTSTRPSIAVIALICGLVSAADAQDSDSGALIEASRERARGQYPDIQDYTSPLAEKVREAVSRARQNDPAFFKNPDWPFIVTQRCAESPPKTARETHERLAQSAEEIMQARPAFDQSRQVQRNDQSTISERRRTETGRIRIRELITEESDLEDDAVEEGDSLPSRIVDVDPSAELIEVPRETEFNYKAREQLQALELENNRRLEEYYQGDSLRGTAQKVTPNAYGLGRNSDEFGRPHVYRTGDGAGVSPIFQDTVKRDTYGSGVHSDTFGRPVYDSSPR